MKKIYVASSWRNDYQPAVVTVLRSFGHSVYDFKNPPGKAGFGWEQIDPNWKNWTIEEYKASLLHPVAVEGYNSDFDAMNSADCCVLVLPCGRSAHTEAGYMRGQGKPVFVFMPVMQEPELMYNVYSGVIGSVNELREIFKNP